VATDTAAPAGRTYGNFRRPVSAGINRRLGLLGSLLCFVGLIAVILAIALFGLLAGAIVFAVVGVVVAALSSRDRHHRTVLQRVATRVGFMWARAKGATFYRSGPTGRVPYGVFALPGLAAGVRASQWTDGFGEPFAVLHHPADNSYSPVLTGSPEGAALVDDEQVDSWVAHWGGFLASLAEEPDLVACSVIIETSPDTGTRLRTEVEGASDPNAHPVAQAMLREVVDTYPSGSASVREWVVPTFSGAAAGTGKKRPTEDVVADLAARLPGFYGDLSSTGAGAVRPATLAEVSEEVRTAYDPDMAALFDLARAAGDDTGLDWSEVGPAATEAGWEVLRHDGAVSITYGMSRPPRGEVYSNVLARMLAPHPHIDRKRVVLLFEPIDPGRAPDVADRDVDNARSRATGPKPSEAAVNDHAAARSIAQSEARGAGLVNFGALITITVTDPERLPAARAALSNLVGTARLRVRPMYGSQDSAFVAALPLGVVPWRHLKVPTDLSEAL
jgi:hypothetical protein